MGDRDLYVVVVVVDFIPMHARVDIETARLTMRFYNFSHHELQIE